MPDEANRLAWLERRRQGIGGSDVPAILGKDRWTSPLDVYRSKVSPVEGDEQNEYQEWGHHNEPAILRVTCERIGETLTRLDLSDQPVEGPAPLWVSPDGLAGKGLVIEAKNVSGWFRRDWEEGPPDSVRLQAAALMAGLDRDRCVVGALFGGNTLEIHEVDRCERLERKVIAFAAAWWARHIVVDVPPEVSRPSDLEATRGLYPQAHRHMLLRADDLEEPAKELMLLKISHRRREELEARLCLRIGEYDGIDAGEVKATWKAAKDSDYFDLAGAKKDLKRAKKNDPEKAALLETLLAGYTRKKRGGRRLALKNGDTDR